MIKKILLTTLIVLLAGGLLGSYFFFVGKEAAKERERTLCDRVEIILLDSLESSIVDKGEMEALVSGVALGRTTARIDLDSIERAIRARGEVMGAEVYAADPPRPSTFLEGDFNMVMDDQCQFHRDAKHTMRECEQLKRALGVPPEPKKTKSGNNDDQNSSRRYDNRNRRPDRRD